MPFDDMYIHTVVVQEYKSVSDGAGGQISEWIDTDQVIPCLLDTPSSTRIFEFQKVDKTLDRDMFYDPIHSFPTKARLKDEVTGNVYKQEGKPLDQGGQGEVMMLPLALV